MVDSLAERAIKEVIRRCGLILTASGYNTNVGTNVLRARRTLDLKASTPAAVVVWDVGESPAERSDGSLAAYVSTQEISVEVHTITDQPNTGVLIGAMKADVERAVLSGSSGRIDDADGDIGSIAWSGAQPVPREAGYATEAMAITFSVRFPKGYGNPNSSQPNLIY